MPKVTGLFKRAGAATFSYSFYIARHRFHGATPFTSRREAEIWLKEFKERKKTELALNPENAPMSFAAAASRWWEDRGQHRADHATMESNLAWLQSNIGMDRMLTAIDNNLVARLVTRRRQDGVRTSTINRSVTEPLRAITRYAAFLGQEVAKVDWREHLLREPPPRIGEISEEDEARLLDNLRPDYQPIIRFLLATGVRRREAALLEWADVDLRNAAITYHLKGGEIEKRPVSDYVVGLLAAERGKHPTRVFTYRPIRALKVHKGAEFVPISLHALDTVWNRLVTACGMKGVRKHDLRHTLLTRVARTSGLHVAQKVAGHKDIKTTMRYAHAAEKDIRDALNAVAPEPLQELTPKLTRSE